jgi:hypothetical protein
MLGQGTLEVGQKHRGLRLNPALLDPVETGTDVGSSPAHFEVMHPLLPKTTQIGLLLESRYGDSNPWLVFG